jgi:epoxyqueuosine reductase
MSDLKPRLVEKARQLGFDAVGVAAASPVDRGGHFARWLAGGSHGEMAYLARRVEKRRDPRELLSGARSVVVLTTYYRHERPPLGGGPRGIVSRYAWARDYHRVVGRRLRKLRRWLEAQEPGARVYAEVDTGPVLEKVWAERAGVGWIGKHGNVLSTLRSSWIFLSVLVTDLALAPDRPHPERCGTCDLCIRACPTSAIVRPGVVDARLCISHHTIEHQGPIPEALREKHGRWLFGCDDCQEVCPWNRFAREPADPAFAPRPEQAHPDLLEILALDEPAFRARFEGTPLMRPGRAGMARNAAVVLGNLADRKAVPALARTLASDPSPVVRGHAAWALGRIGSAGARAALAEAGATEPDAAVRAEIERALRAPELKNP